MIRSWSLRRRLAFVAAAFGTAVSLVAISIVFAGEVVAVRTITLELLEEDLEQLRRQDGQSEMHVEIIVRAEAYAIFEGERRIRAAQSWDRMGLSLADLRGIQSDREKRLSIHREGRDIRVLAVQDRSTGRIFAVARDETKTNRAIATLGWVVVSASPLLIIMSCAGGIFIAGIIVRPVTRLQNQIAGLGATRLSSRVKIDRGPRELISLANDFNKMLSRLEDAFEAQRRFAADASHELRTPLAAMRAVGESAMLGHTGQEGMRDVVAGMLEEADRLTRIVEQLLSIARLSPEAVEATTVDVALIAERVVDRLRPLAEEANISLSIEGNGVVARADATLVDRIISSLIDNAIRHGGNGCNVSIRVHRDRADAVLQIADDGRGIAPEDLARIWAPFARGRGAARGTGSGLGLTLTQTACRVMGCSISVESTPNEGTTFEVRFPLAN